MAEQVARDNLANRDRIRQLGFNPDSPESMREYLAMLDEARWQRYPDSDELGTWGGYAWPDWDNES